MEQHDDLPNPPPLRTIESARAVILRSSSSDAIRLSALDSLLRLLGHEQDQVLRRQALKLIGDAAVMYPYLFTSSSSSFIGAVRSFLSGGKHPAAEALSFLLSVADTGGGGDGRMSFVGSVLDEEIILSLASSHVFAIRSRLLDLLLLDVNSAKGFTLLRPGGTFRVFFGLTGDLYPSVRSAALDGLAALCKVNDAEVLRLMMGSVYDRATELLRDEDGQVRTASVRLVSEWGQMLVANPMEGVDVSRVSDSIFVQICSMARDMDVRVRIEAFKALGKVKLVSEMLLLQSLSKKVLASHNGGKDIDQYSTNLVKESKFSLSSAAGAFIHGLEDEFYEVRRAACISLGVLSIFSIQFANGALNLLMDMLNDDTIGVKLQTLQTFLNMARHDRLKVQEIHMHMFLGMFADISGSIRNAARKVLRVVALTDMEMFKSCIYHLFTNLETYPEDEEDVLNVLFHIGKNHGRWVTTFLGEFIQEVEPSCKGEMNLDRPRVAALLVLAISSHFSCENNIGDIPQKIFSSAIPFLGRIYSSLQGLVNRDCLLVYLFRHSGIPFSAIDSDFKERAQLPHAVEEVISNNTGTDQSCCAICRIHHETSEIQFKEKMDSGQALGRQPQLEVTSHKDAIHSVKQILRMVAEAWSLVQSQNIHEVAPTLRACKEEIEMIAGDNSGISNPVLAFASQYIEVIQLIADSWGQLLPRNVHVVGVQKLDILLRKLDLALRKMRYTFPGFSKEEEAHVLELALLGCVTKLHRVRICPQPLLRRIWATISRMEHLYKEDFPKVSDFVKKLKDISCLVGTNQASLTFPVDNLLKLFSLEQIQFSGKFRHIKAELLVPGNDSENPLPFISGLPVGITFQTKLYNVSKNERLWLQMNTGELIQYAYLDLCQFGGSDEVRYCTTDVPFYGTPKAAAFVLEASVVMECPLEYVTHMRKGKGGLKYATTSLCEVKNVYLVNIDNKL